MLAGISRFLGGKHSLLRSWVDFMVSMFCTTPDVLANSLFPFISVCLGNRAFPPTNQDGNGDGVERRVVVEGNVSCA